MKMEIKKEEGHYEDNKNVNGGFFMNQIKKLIKKVSLKRPIKWLFFILQNNIIRAENILWESK
jgi:hypothetical protein